MGALRERRDFCCPDDLTVYLTTRMITSEPEDVLLGVDRQGRFFASVRADSQNILSIEGNVRDFAHQKVYPIFVFSSIEDWVSSSHVLSRLYMANYVGKDNGMQYYLFTRITKANHQRLDV